MEGGDLCGIQHVVERMAIHVEQGQDGQQAKQEPWRTLVRVSRCEQHTANGEHESRIPRAARIMEVRCQPHQWQHNLNPRKFNDEWHA